MRILKTSHFFLITLVLQACQFTSISEPSRPTTKHNAAACTHEGGNDGESNTQHIILGDMPLEVSDSITGYEFHDYVFFGKKDSQLSIQFSARYALPILFQEDTIYLKNGTPYVIPGTRCYRLRILMMRVFARRGNESPYQMTLNVTPASGATARH